MPLYDFKCEDCGSLKEHFILKAKSKKVCPECGSDNYNKLISTFTLNVEYGNVKDIVENKIDPSVKETFAKIGKEALDQNTKTLDNIYGTEKVKETFYEHDD